MRWSLLLIAACLLACREPAPVPIVWGEDVCEHCHMTITDPRFAAELLTRTGKVMRFDDIGCLAEFSMGDRVTEDQVHSRWVMNYLHPEEFLSVEDAIFLHSDSLRTPMNHGLLAVRPSPAADSLREALGGRLMTWPEVLRLVAAGSRS